MYLNLAGLLGVVDIVEGLLDGFAQSHQTMVPQHYHLQREHLVT